MNGHYALGIGMFGKIAAFLFVLIISSCSTVTQAPTQCRPSQSFKPTSAKVTLSGSVIFSNGKADYYFDLPEASWTCAIPNSRVTNLFRGIDAATLLRATTEQKNNKQDVLKTRIGFKGGGDFRLFVDEQCTSLGLSYLFEINSSKGEEIYGCQISPQVASAIMWKRTAQAPFVDLAYLPFYQPFVDSLSEAN